MGLFDFVKNQFIEVIEATDFQQDMIVFEFPVAGHEIKMGAQLIVREGQCAIFLNEGTLADVFGPGHYTLSTENMPVLSKLKAQGRNLNQLTTLANMGKVTILRGDALADKYEAICGQLCHLLREVN